jgi:5-methylcytosine-specific restriction endonuclease McrA
MFKEDNLEKIKIIVLNSQTLNEVFKKLNLNSSGNNYKVFRRYINKYNISTDHFLTKSEHTKKLYEEGKLEKNSNSEIFVENSLTSRSTVKQRIISDNLLEYKCILCGNTGEWLGKKISLILDHENGINNDNRLENLRFVCPNCNATLETHCRGSKGLEVKINKKEIYFENKKREYENSQKDNITKVLESDIDFKNLGWVTEVSKIIKISPQKSAKWVQRFLPEIYEESFKRKSPCK